MYSPQNFQTDELTISPISLGMSHYQETSYPDYFHDAPDRSPRMDAIKRELNINTFKTAANDAGSFVVDTTKKPSNVNYARVERRLASRGSFDPANPPLNMYLKHGWRLVEQARHPETGNYDDDNLEYLRSTGAFQDELAEADNRFITYGNTVLIEKDSKADNEANERLLNPIKSKEYKVSKAGFNSESKKHGMFHMDIDNLTGMAPGGGSMGGQPTFY